MLALQRPSDLALLDIGLPDMDGLQVLAALRTDARTMSMPVVILCSWDDPELIRRGLSWARSSTWSRPKLRLRGCPTASPVGPRRRTRGSAVRPRVHPS